MKFSIFIHQPQLFGSNKHIVRMLIQDDEHGKHRHVKQVIVIVSTLAYTVKKERTSKGS